jgi:outer membrane protein insertion porin family
MIMKYYLFFLFSILVTLQGCSKKVYLGDDDFVLVENRLVLKNAKNVKNPSNLKLQLTAHCKQLPASSSLTSFSTKKKVVYSVVLKDSTISDMVRFMQNKGYLYPKVEAYPTNNLKFKTVVVNYLIDPGALYVVGDVVFKGVDSTIVGVLKENQGASLLKMGSPIESDLFVAEKKRISGFLNSIGYASFAYTFVNYESDTSQIKTDIFGNKKVNVSINIQKTVASDGNYRRYSVGEIRVYPDYNILKGTDFYKHDSLIEGVHFMTENGTMPIKSGILLSAIGIRPGNSYSRKSDEASINKLSKLNVFRPLGQSSIKLVRDDADSSKFNYGFFLSPLKRLSLESGVEVNYSSTQQSITNSLLGFAIDVNYGNKNLFKGAEHLNTSASVNTDIRYFFDIRGGLNITYPRFNNLLGQMKLYNFLGLLGNDFYKNLKENGVTQLSTNGSYSIRYDPNNSEKKKYFDLFSYDLGLKYTLKKSENEVYSFTPMGILWFEPSIPEGSAFQTTVESNQFLKKSLTSQLSTGLFFRSFRYDYLSNFSENGVQRGLSVQLEQSGLEVMGINAVLGKPWEIYKLGNTDFSKYFRIDLEAKTTKQLNARNTEFAIKGYIGIAQPFNQQSVVPYLRQLYVGGPFSIRAFQSRSIGPGGYEDNSPKNIRYQTGDFKLEFGSEYRFPLFWIFNGAVLLDAGNVWTLNNDPDRPFSQFKVENALFLKQIAIGSGLGLRIDITYAKIRLDFGFPIRTPVQGAAGGVWTNDFTWGLVNPNFDLRLPF